MNYELAKELKDAGYPQHPHALPSEPCAPTLSELIEACGDELALILRGAEGRWFAQGFGKYGGTNYLGSTPEEAVARLWLALNKKV